jgi:hypothetical protein
MERSYIEKNYLDEEFSSIKKVFFLFRALIWISTFSDLSSPVYRDEEGSN